MCTRDENGATPLHRAAIAADFAKCVYLLECGADVNALNNNGKSPLHWALLKLMCAHSEIDKASDQNEKLNALLDICNLLLQKGAQVYITQIDLVDLMKLQQSSKRLADLFNQLLLKIPINTRWGILLNGYLYRQCLDVAKLFSRNALYVDALGMVPNSPQEIGGAIKERKKEMPNTPYFRIMVAYWILRTFRMPKDISYFIFTRDWRIEEDVFEAIKPMLLRQIERGVAVLDIKCLPRIFNKLLVIRIYETTIERLVGELGPIDGIFSDDGILKSMLQNVVLRLGLILNEAEERKIASQLQLNALGIDSCVKYVTRNARLHVAARLGEVNVVKYLLLCKENPNTFNMDGLSPLQVAVQFGNRAVELVNILCEHGADPNMDCKDGVPLIHKAPFDVVFDLLRHGANLNAKDCEGNTLLHKEIIKLGKSQPLDLETKFRINALLDSGADVRAKNNAGKTPLDLAMQNTELKTFLLAACKKKKKIFGLKKSAVK